MIVADGQALLKIVLIEDDEDDYIITEALLAEGFRIPYQLDWLRDRDSGLEALTSGAYDIALIDYRLGPESGLELIGEASQKGVSTPAILLTGQGDDVLDAKAIELGASDYLVKGLVDAHGLARSIRYSVDRAHATHRLMASEARYRLLFEENPEPLLLVAPDTQEVISMNTAAESLYGMQHPTDAEQRLYFDALMPAAEQRSLIGASAYPPSFQPSPGSALTLQRRYNGSVFYAEVISNTITVNRQQVMLMMVSDVTERIRALQRADQNEEAFLRVLNDLRDATLVVDSHNRVQFANPAAQQWLEVEAGSELSLSVELLEANDVNVVNHRLKLSDGRSLWVEIQSSPTQWHGKSMRLFSIRDISERMAAESQLRLLQRGMEASSNGITIADATKEDFPLIYVNPAFERITGYREQEVLGRNCRFLQSPDSDQAAVQQIRSAIAARTEVSVVIKNTKKDGSVFWNDLFIAPVPDEQGAITHLIGIQSDISDRKSAESALAYNASHDVLTGLPNRSLFEDRLRQGRELAARHKRHLAVLYIDLDDFKLINDSLGHSVGDQVIVDVAERLRSLLRAGDTVARLNADEFVVLLPDLASGDHVIELAEKILGALAVRFQINDEFVHVTASIGITLDDRSIDNPMRLLQQADLAMHRAKLQGRNTYQWYSSDLNTEANKRVVLRNELQTAIEQGQLCLFYQPLIDSRSRKVVGNEALIRWMHPEKGLIPPNDFLSVAEDTGQILQIGPWVLEQACLDTKRLHDLGFQDCTVAVNVAALQLRQADFVRTVERALEKSGLPPSYLELEVVESVLLQETEQVIATMNALKTMGVGISIDDFGTGFSSLSYIKMLPATKIKIDRAFVRDVIRDRSDAAITQGVIALAHNLELKTVAEGVETDAQAAFLGKHRCDLMQGYLFSRPIPMDALIDFMRHNADTDFVKGKAVTIDGDQKTLLLLDDEENILKALSRTLRRDGYRIFTAQTASEAFEHLANHPIHVVVSDQRMPEISGTEFLRQVKDIYPETIRIVLSGYTDLQSVTDAINQGNIYKFLTKPWDDSKIREHIGQAFLHYYAAQRKQKE